VLDGFQPRERIDAPSARRQTGGEDAAELARFRKRRTGTVMKTVPVGAFARIVLG